MQNQPLISVLMGIYNCADTLEEAVECILNQTYENWELIMCDDCSSDNTLEVAKKIAEKDSRIRVIKNDKNLTLAPTLNHCFEEAKGEYLARMDGDDICDKDRFIKEADFLKNNSEYAVVSCAMHIFDDKGVYGTVYNPEKPDYSDLAKQSPICHAGCMIRSDVFKLLNGYIEDESVERIEDYDLWFRLFVNGYKAYNIQEPLYSMREGRDAIKRKKFKFRVTEYKLRKRVCKQFGLGFKSKLNAFKPIIIGLMPQFVYSAVHRKRYKN